MLNRSYPTLAASCYYSRESYRSELDAIWWNDWLCIARQDEWSEAGSFQVFNVGGQQIIVTRSDGGALRAYHNTCRHRGSELCQAQRGKFAKKRIVCPYHGWVYSLEGELVRTPRRIESEDFTTKDKSLYPVAIDVWGGFVFINLSAQPGHLLDALGKELAATSSWPLADLAMAHQEVHEIDCNWKVFWETFLECYHCPGIHKDLCQLVPLYGKGLNSDQDLVAAGLADALPPGSRLRPGAVTWSANGQTELPWFDGLSAEEQAAGMTFSSIWPSFYLVAHVDHVRSVQVMPLGPEQTRLTISWMVLPDTIEQSAADVLALTHFGRQVVLEDARVCELNQRGLHSIRHQHGTLVGQEYDVLAFNNRVRQRLGLEQLE